MPIKLEFISTKEPKWHIFYKKQPNSNEGDVIVYKCNGEEMPISNEITGCESNMGNINQYITFYGKVIDNLNTAYHLMPFKDNNIPKEAITGKMLIKLEEAIQNAINNNEEFNGICGICPWNCKIDAPHRADCKSVKIIRALYKTYKINHYQNNIPAEIDTFKLESEHQAATAMVEANMAEFHAEQQEIKAKQQQERETLLAEASRLTGRVEAFNFISKLTTVGSLMIIKKIKESGVYKELPNIKTWADYCKSIGFSVNKIDEDLLNLNTFGENLLTTVGDFSLGYKDLRELRKQVKAGNLEVRDAEVIIDGEVIPLDDKDELRDALDTLLKSKYKEIEELKDEIKNKESIIEDKEHDIKRLQSSNNTFFKEKEQAERELNYLKAEGSINGVSLEDNPDFQAIKNCENESSILIERLIRLAEKDLSKFNKSMLGGTVIKIMNDMHNLHQELCSLGISDYFGDAFVDDDVINAENALITPTEFLKQAE